MAINVAENNFSEYNLNSSLYCISTSEKSVVSNRIEDTQRCSLTGRKDVLQVNPQSIYFHGFKIGGRYCQTLNVINTSQECQRVHIFAPTCKEFNIKYENKLKLYPGMSLKVLIEFKPKENNFLQDSINISCKDISNLNVPIYAYLYLDLSTFPNLITFKPTVVGLSDVKKVPLQNNTPVNFDFQIGFIEKNASFSASPLEGVLPGNSCIDITLKYSPLEFCTSVSKLQILIYQFNSKPHICTLTGSCQPGLAAKLKEKEQELIPKMVLDPQVVSPLGRVRVKKLVSKSISKQNCETNEIEVDGIRFPKDLHNIAAVNYVLMQKPNRKKEDATISNESDCIESVSKFPSKQTKEVLFEDIVNKNVSEEQRNHIGWHVHLGEEIVSQPYKNKIMNDRTQGLAKQENVKKQAEKYNTEKLFKKTCRPSNSELDLQPSFFLYKNDDWGKRHMFLQKFIQAARKVIIHNRLLKVLKSFSSRIPQWRQGIFELQQTKTIQEEVASNAMERFFECHFIKPCTNSFVKDYGDFVEPEPYLLGLIDIKPTEVLLTTEPELLNLEVPQQYKLLSYMEVPCNRSVTKHVSKRLPRKLKTGLESIDPKLFTSEDKKNSLMPLLPPKFLQESTQYHSMHIFNPLPGAQIHPQPLAYSEIDSDYGLCPLNMANQYIHSMQNEKNMLPELMCWKRFPSQGLIAMQNERFENSSSPLNDLFNNDLLSFQIPSLLNSLPDDDIMEECSEMEFFDYPTMDFVKSNFKTSFCLQKEVTNECFTDSTSQSILQSCSVSLSRETNSCDHQSLYDKMQENLLNIQQSWNVSKAFEDALRTS